MPPETIDFRLTLEDDPTQGYLVTAHGPGDTYARAQVPHALDAVWGPRKPVAFCPGIVQTQECQGEALGIKQR